MPTPRKRIGFLPSSEVQNIIDSICEFNNLSQSKVTGILVEEALNSRGVLNKPTYNLSFDFTNSDDISKKIGKNFLNNYQDFNDKNINLDEGSINRDLEMINEFIEYKFFKKIINQNKINSNN